MQNKYYTHENTVDTDAAQVITTSQWQKSRCCFHDKMLPQLSPFGVSSLDFCNARVSPPHSPASPLCKQHFWTCAKD